MGKRKPISFNTLTNITGNEFMNLQTISEDWKLELDVLKAWINDDPVTTTYFAVAPADPTDAASVNAAVPAQAIEGDVMYMIGDGTVHAPAYVWEVFDNAGTLEAMRVERKVGTTSHLSASNAAGQTANLSIGDRISFDTQDGIIGSDISLTGSQFTLAANKPYKLTAAVGKVVFLSTKGELAFRWYDVTAGAYIGHGGGATADTGLSNQSNHIAAIAHIFVPTQETVVELRITASTDVQSIGFTSGQRDLLASAQIECLTSSSEIGSVTINGGGGGASTFLELTDTPSSGTQNLLLGFDAGGNSVETKPIPNEHLTYGLSDGSLGWHLNMLTYNPAVGMLRSPAFGSDYVSPFDSFTHVVPADATFSEFVSNTADSAPIYKIVLPVHAANQVYTTLVADIKVACLTDSTTDTPDTHAFEELSVNIAANIDGKGINRVLVSSRGASFDLGGQVDSGISRMVRVGTDVATGNIAILIGEDSDAIADAFRRSIIVSDVYCNALTVDDLADGYILSTEKTLANANVTVTDTVDYRSAGPSNIYTTDGQWIEDRKITTNDNQLKLESTNSDVNFKNNEFKILTWNGYAPQFRIRATDGSRTAETPLSDGDLLFQQDIVTKAGGGVTGDEISIAGMFKAVARAHNGGDWRSAEWQFSAKQLSGAAAWADHDTLLTIRHDYLQANLYGAGNKKDSDLSKTYSGYLTGFATDGTLVEVATDQLAETIETVTDATPARTTTITLIDSTANPVNLQVDPTAMVVGKIYTAKAITDPGTNAITLTPTSGTIDGAVNHSFSLQYDAISFFTDGTNLFIN